MSEMGTGAVLPYSSFKLTALSLYRVTIQYIMIEISGYIDIGTEY